MLLGHVMVQLEAMQGQMGDKQNVHRNASWQALPEIKGRRWQAHEVSIGHLLHVSRQIWHKQASLLGHADNDGWKLSVLWHKAGVCNANPLHTPLLVNFCCWDPEHLAVACQQASNGSRNHRVQLIGVQPFQGWPKSAKGQEVVDTVHALLHASRALLAACLDDQ